MLKHVRWFPGVFEPPQRSLEWDISIKNPLFSEDSPQIDTRTSDDGDTSFFSIDNPTFADDDNDEVLDIEDINALANWVERGYCAIGIESIVVSRDPAVANYLVDECMGVV